MESEKKVYNQFLNLNQAQKDFIYTRFSQYRLAKTIGVSVNAINDMFLGKRRTRIETYEKVAAALGITLAELFAIK